MKTTQKIEALMHHISRLDMLHNCLLSANCEKELDLCVTNQHFNLELLQLNKPTVLFLIDQVKEARGNAGKELEDIGREVQKDNGAIFDGSKP